MAPRLASAAVLALGRLLLLDLVGGERVLIRHRGHRSRCLFVDRHLRLACHGVRISRDLRLQGRAGRFLHLARHTCCFLTRQGATQTKQGQPKKAENGPT